MRLFIKDNIWYIVIYFISIIITEGYLILLGSIAISECLYILLFNTVMLIIFFAFRYYRNKEVYEIFNKELENIDQCYMDLGDSVLGENISRILKEEHNLYEAELIKSNKQYNEHLTFINNWVHQMKTPLSVMKLQMEEYEGEEPYESIKQEVDKLNKGLNMAMYYARLGSFKKDFVVNRISLYKLVVNKINEEKQLFIKSKIKPKVDIAESIEVYSDEKWLKFILEQLIVNGLKYSKGYGAELVLKALDEDKSIKLLLIDEGVGIPKKDIKRVFDPFFTGSNGRKFGESTGMGLYMVKKICDALGHKVYINSIRGARTTVTIEFFK